MQNRTPFDDYKIFSETYPLMTPPQKLLRFQVQAILEANDKTEVGIKLNDIG